MYNEIDLRLNEIKNNINNIDTCIKIVNYIIDNHSFNDNFVFLIYKFNCFYLEYLSSIDNSYTLKKYKNDELYMNKFITNDEKKELLYSLSLELINYSKNILSNNNYFVLYSFLIDKINFNKVVNEVNYYNNSQFEEIDNSIDNLETNNIANNNTINIIEYQDVNNDTTYFDSNNNNNNNNNNNVIVENTNEDFKFEEINNGVDNLETNNISYDNTNNVVEYQEFNNDNLASNDNTVFNNNTDINSFKKKSGKKINYKIVFLYGIFIVIILILLFVLSKVNSNIVVLNNKLNESLDGYSIEQKNEELDKLKNEISEIDTIISNYNNEIEVVDDKIANIIVENEKITNDLAMKENELNSKINTYNDLKNKYRELTTFKISNVITYNQYPNYPNGCEAVALYILLRYYGVEVNIDSVMDSLPIGRVPYDVDGVLYGGDPNYEFLGDPRSSDGWGIYDQGLSYSANKFKSGIINGTGMDFKDIYSLIKSNRPVIVWTSIDLIDPYISTSWISDKTGETIYWKRYNHAVVVIGYTDDSIIVSDPIDGKIKYFNKQKFIYVYNFMGRRVLYY